MLTCYQATALVERTAGQASRVGTLVALRVHLRRCVLCRRYQQQSRLLTRLARTPVAPEGLRLRPAFKDELRARLL